MISTIQLEEDIAYWKKLANDVTAAGSCRIAAHEQVKILEARLEQAERRKEYD